MSRPASSESQHSLSSEEFREVAGHFLSGVTVITAHDGERPWGTTASAFCSLSLNPPMLLVCLNESSETGVAVHRTRRFAVNVLSKDQQDLAIRFARKGDDKFDGVVLEEGAGELPLLADALATFECRVSDDLVGGTHRVFLAEVTHASARQGIPLAYFRGEFGELNG